MANEKGKKLLAELASKVQKKVTPDGAPERNARGLELIDELAGELGAEGVFPGLRVFRDGVAKFRLQRPSNYGEIAVAWDRAIGAVVVEVHRGQTRDSMVRYVYDEPAGEWRRLDGPGELYADVTKALGDVLYPESKH